MPKRTLKHKDRLRERLKDPRYAAEYLRAGLEDDEEDSEAVLLLMLRDVAEAFQISKVAEESGLSRESLYRMLSARGNPTLRSLKQVLKALGLRLSLEPIKDESRQRPGRMRISA